MSRAVQHFFRFLTSEVHENRLTAQHNRERTGDVKRDWFADFAAQFRSSAQVSLDELFASHLKELQLVTKWNLKILNDLKRFEIGVRLARWPTTSRRSSRPLHVHIVIRRLREVLPDFPAVGQLELVRLDFLELDRGYFNDYRRIRNATGRGWPKM